MINILIRFYIKILINNFVSKRAIKELTDEINPTVQVRSHYWKHKNNGWSISQKIIREEQYFIKILNKYNK